MKLHLLLESALDGFIQSFLYSLSHFQSNQRGFEIVMTTGKTLKAQLASIRNRIFAKSAMVQAVSQVAFECESGDTQSAFLTAQKEVLKEVARRTWTTEIGISIAPNSNTLRLPALLRRARRCARRSGIVVRRGVHGQYANVIYQPAVWLCAVLPEKRRAARRDHGADLSRLAAVSDITGNGPRDLYHFPRSRPDFAVPAVNYNFSALLARAETPG